MNKQEQKRLVKWRSGFIQHALEVSGNVSATCRYYGISRQTFYKWKRRYDASGQTALVNRSHGPHNHPNKTPPEVVHKVLYLRQNYYFGPRKISYYLKRSHDIDLSHATVHTILKRFGINRLPASQKHKAYKRRYKSYEKQKPGHRLQVDVKFLQRIPGTHKRFYQFTAIDDCTRIRVLKSTTSAIKRPLSGSWTKSSGGCPLAFMSCKPTMEPSSRPAFIGTYKPKASSMSLSNLVHRISTAKWNAPIEPMTKSFIKSSIKTASQTIFASSIKNSNNGRITTTSIDLIAASLDKHLTND